MKNLPHFTPLARELYDKTRVRLGKKTKIQFDEEIVKEFGNRGDNFLMAQAELQSVVKKMKL